MGSWITHVLYLPSNMLHRDRSNLVRHVRLFFSIIPFFVHLHRLLRLIPLLPLHQSFVDGCKLAAGRSDSTVSADEVSFPSPTLALHSCLFVHLHHVFLHFHVRVQDAAVCNFILLPIDDVNAVNCLVQEASSQLFGKFGCFFFFFGRGRCGRQVWFTITMVNYVWISTTLDKNPLN